jgi:hypothetical protein
MKTISLTDEEAYILACIIGYMKPDSKVYSLLGKMDALVDKELDCDDFDRVAFQIDIEKGQVSNVEIVFN